MYVEIAGPDPWVSDSDHAKIAAVTATTPHAKTFPCLTSLS
jgi:hypothetical protein